MSPMVEDAGKAVSATTARERDFYRYYNPEAIDKVKSTLPSSSHDTALTAFAQLGALRLNTKRCLISLFSAHEQHIIAEATQTLSLQSDTVHAHEDGLWLGTTTLPKEQGICQVVADLPVDNPLLEAAGQSVIISDLTKDERTANLEFVKDQKCGRFFAGVPILSPKGHHIGTYCVLDDEPRSGITGSGLEFLTDMSRTVMSYLELARAREEYRRGERMVRGLGSFHEGKSTLRNWRPATGASFGGEDRTYEASRVGIGGEGQLNEEQQEAQSSQDQQELLMQDPADAMARLTEGAGNSQNTNAHVQKHEKKLGITFALPPPSSSAPSSFGAMSRPSVTSHFTETFSSGAPSVGTADPETGDRLTLQEDMLSMGVKAAFSRASNIIRESIEVEGSIFIDAAVGGSYEGLGNDDSNQSLDTTSSSGHTSSSESSRKSSGSKSSRESGGSASERMCGVLGFSTSHTSSINNSILSRLHGLIPENLLKGLVKRYPKGKIFHFTEDGQASSGSSSETTYDSNTHPGPDQEKPLSQARARRKADRRFSRRTDAEEIIKVFPGARSIAITPLWDSHRSRWFSLGVAWTNNPKRVLSVEGELSYLASFGNTIMAEVARLDALTAEKAKTDLLGSISHELRSPLHGILGSVELLEESVTGSLQANLVNCIETCGRTLLDTIDHLLDYTKINHSSQLARHERSAEKFQRESGHPSKPKKSKDDLVVQVDVDICAITEEVLTAVSAGYDVHRVAALRSGSPRRSARPLDSSYADDTSGTPASLATKPSQLDNVAVSINISSESSWLFTTQPGAWRRIVMNLFSNSLKYTDRGFINVTLKTEPLPSKNGRQRSKLILNVSDSGRGMSKDYLQGKLFTPFSQEDQLAPGTGLGLSIIRQIVKSLGGRIEVRSKRGSVEHGTNVCVTIPMVHSESSATSPTLSSPTYIRTMFQGMEICLPRPDEKTEGSIVDFELSSLKGICETWFGMRVHSGFDTPTIPDFYLIVENSANQESLRSGELFQKLRLKTTQEKPLQVIVICQTPFSTNIFEQSYPISDKTKILDFVCQPCGPRKMGKSLLRCLKRRTKLATLPQVTGQGLQAGCPTPPQEEVVQSAAQQQPIHTEQTQTVVTPPTTTPPEPERQESSPQETPGGAPLDAGPFLLVDDNHINLQVLKMFMTKHNFAHSTALDGLDALEAYKLAANSQPFKIIFMDISMPNMDGLTSTRHIRAFEREHNLAPASIIVLTGLGSASVQQEAFASGANLLLTKPVRLKELGRILAEMKAQSAVPGALSSAGDKVP